jgi:hypothetical protein
MMVKSVFIPCQTDVQSLLLPLGPLRPYSYILVKLAIDLCGHVGIGGGSMS